MKLKVIQSQVGSFNLGSNEESYVFKLGIVDDNGNVITKDIAFWEIYMDNHDELDQNYATARKSNIQKQIERLQAELKKIKALPDLDCTGHFVFHKERTKNESLAAKCEEIVKQLVKGSEMYDDEKRRIQHYRKLINKYDLLVKKSGC